MGKLNYLEACAHEAMRLRPVAPIIGLDALRDTTIANIHVPAGTPVWCVMRHDSVSERHFVNAGEFRPERWLDDANSPSAPSVAKRVAMPFGSGPRTCPGRYLALMEIKIVVAMLLSQFDKIEVGTVDGKEVAERLAFTMAPVGLRMRVSASTT